MTGARVPRRGWVLSTERLRSVVPADDEQIVSASGLSIAVNQSSMTARVPAGCTLAELDLLLERVGLLYPPDPTERTATVGGSIATNASGARSFCFGATRDWVEALDLVLPDGTMTSIRRGERARGRNLDVAGLHVVLPSRRHYRWPRCKNATGYFVQRGMDAVDLFVGGEGTLAVVAAAELRLVARPRVAGDIMVFFRDDRTLLRAAHALSRHPFRMTRLLSMEYFDNRSLDLLRSEYTELPSGTSSLLLELALPAGRPDRQPGDPDREPVFPESSIIHEWHSFISRLSSSDIWLMPANEHQRTRELRHRLPELVNAQVRAGFGKVGTDFAVPRRRLGAMMRLYREASRGDLPSVLFGHIGECHLHMNFLARDENDRDEARRRHDALAWAAVRLGGTVSAEHGVGKKVATVAGRGGRSGVPVAGCLATPQWAETPVIPYAEVLFGSDGMAELSRIKTQLDPNGILNPGTLIREPGS